MEIIDVSKWQGLIDWPAVKAQNSAIKGVYIKATEGIGHRDPFLEKNAIKASQNGFNIGFYHFASLNNQGVVTDAVAEAREFVKAISSYKQQLPPALDIETNAAKLSPQKCQQWIIAFFDELRRLGVNDYVLYSYAPFLNSNLPANHPFGNIKLWLAAYIPKPIIPKGWAKYWLWQYSSNGSVSGIKGNVDLNRF